MQPWPDPDEWRELHAGARKAAAHLRLPFHRQTWRGTVGNWMGAGVGSSIDFQDHRPYLPGDDPRYIDWQAYARTGNYIMKLYREEVSPRLDLVLDASNSMFLSPEKQTRSLELFYFCVESAARAGATVRAYAIAGETVRILPNDAIHTHALDNFQSLERPPAEISKDWKKSKTASPAYTPVIPSLMKIPFRPGSMRVCISDLLFPGEPEAVLQPLVMARGRGLVLTPYDAGEAKLDFDGNVEFVECETQALRIQRIDVGLRERYDAAYKRHFDLWRDAARRYGITFARVPTGLDLVTALRAHALPEGAAEVT